MDIYYVFNSDPVLTKLEKSIDFMERIGFERCGFMVEGEAEPRKPTYKGILFKSLGICIGNYEDVFYGDVSRIIFHEPLKHIRDMSKKLLWIDGFFLTSGDSLFGPDTFSVRGTENHYFATSKDVEILKKFNDFIQGEEVKLQVEKADVPLLVNEF
ncbi:MAG: hypothetical protein DRP11_01605 [Candidatus Aenigmatarchaeota archaeon]|nr:MAG: hypothetical protein DRP11_01605 [Candidatus Aenigmarchaeota archaeon]